MRPARPAQGGGAEVGLASETKAVRRRRLELVRAALARTGPRRPDGPRSAIQTLPGLARHTESRRK